jgi:hypothetical protein
LETIEEEDEEQEDGDYDYESITTWSMDDLSDYSPIGYDPYESYDWEC